MSSTEHVLIPRAKYQQLLQRMTEKSSNPIGSDVSNLQPDNSRRRITPTKIESEDHEEYQQGEKENNNKLEFNTPKYPPVPDDQHDQSTELHKPLQLDKQKPIKATSGKRSWEEIMNNHNTAAFLPPGENPTVGEKQTKDVAPKKKTNKKTLNKDAYVIKHSKSREKARKKAKPYSSLSKKWVSL